MKWFFPVGLFWIGLIFSCSPQDDLTPPTNPYDPDNPDYELPSASVIGEIELGEIIDSTAVTIIWRGNKTAYEYCYRYDLDSIETEWSAWTRDTSVTLRYLDEGNYQFEIKARTNQTVPVEGEVSTFHFTVDAVKGPATRCFPMYQELSVGQEGEIEIIAEEVDSLMGAEFQILFNPTVIRINRVALSPFLYGDGANGVSFKEIDNDNGMIEVVVVRSSGTEPTVSGTGAIAILEIEALSAGITHIEINKSVFKNQNNDEINVDQRVNGIVGVK